jgi:hypothetical protein
MNVPHAITKKPLTITPTAATKKLDITPISHLDTICMLPIMQKKRLNIPQKMTVPTNYGSNLARLTVLIPKPRYRMSLT